MKRSTILITRIVLTLLGAAGMVVDSVTYDDEEVLFEAGPVEASASVEREYRVPPLVAGGVLGLGLAITFVGILRRR